MDILEIAETPRELEYQRDGWKKGQLDLVHHKEGLKTSVEGAYGFFGSSSFLQCNVIGISFDRDAVNRIVESNERRLLHIEGEPDQDKEIIELAGRLQEILQRRLIT